MKNCHWIARRAVLAAAVMIPVLAQPVLGAPASLESPTHREIRAYPRDPNLASFMCQYIDPNGAIVGYHAVRYPAESTATLDLEDLQIPEGYYLNEEWQTYQTEPGEWLYIDFAVAPENEQLAAVMSQPTDVDFSRTTLTFNYWDTEGNLLDSQNYQRADRRVSSGISEYTLHNGTDYVFDVPEGYQIISDVYDSYTIPMKLRQTVDVIVAPAGLEDYSDEALTYEEEYSDESAINEEEYSIEAEKAAPADDETNADNTVNTALGTRAGVMLGALIVSGTALGFIKRKKQK